MYFFRFLYVGTNTNFVYAYTNLTSRTYTYINFVYTYAKFVYAYTNFTYVYINFVYVHIKIWEKKSRIQTLYTCEYKIWYTYEYKLCKRTSFKKKRKERETKRKPEKKPNRNRTKPQKIVSSLHARAVRAPSPHATRVQSRAPSRARLTAH